MSLLGRAPRHDQKIFSTLRIFDAIDAAAHNDAAAFSSTGWGLCRTY